MAGRTFTVELSADAAEYLEAQVSEGRATSVSVAIEQALESASQRLPSDGDPDEYRAFLTGAADTYEGLRAGTMTASPLADVRARLEDSLERDLAR